MNDLILRYFLTGAIGDLILYLTRCAITFLGALQVLFIALKLTNYINWSWWLVMSPFFVPCAVMLAIAALVVYIAKLAEISQ